MKLLAEKQALPKLAAVKAKLRDEVAPFEKHAKNCVTCETKGACCIDAHFVNVHITRLEAIAMRRDLARLGTEHLAQLDQKIDETIKNFSLLDTADSFSKTYACPLFDRERGCLVHSVKPIPCIVHACYEGAGDLPPDEIQITAEKKVSDLNEQTYLKPAAWLPLPVFLNKIADSE